jgi:hypothetical protein
MPSKSITEICERLGRSPQAMEAVSSDSNYVALLPLLEHSLADVELQLQAGLVAVGIPPECIERISLERLVLFALGSWGEHWSALALLWLESGFAISRDIAQALQSLSTKKGLPQQVRQVTSKPSGRMTPNPSIERTCPGKPGHASHLKR